MIGGAIRRSYKEDCGFMKTFAMAAAVVICSATFASAQEQGVQAGLAGERAAGTVNLNFNASAAAAAAQAARTGTARKYIPRVFAGLWTSAGTGFLVGAGVSTRPFSEEKHEIQGNASYNHVEGSNGFGVDIDYLYNFSRPSTSTVLPFAAAGLNINHFGGGCGDLEDLLGVDLNCGGTDAALQIGGGFKKPLKSGKEFFGELYFVLSDSNPILLRAGIGW